MQEFVEKSNKYSPDAYSKVDIWRKNWQILAKSPVYFQPKTGDLRKLLKNYEKD